MALVDEGPAAQMSMMGLRALAHEQLDQLATKVAVLLRSAGGSDPAARAVLMQFELQQKAMKLALDNVMTIVTDPDVRTVILKGERLGATRHL